MKKINRAIAWIILNSFFIAQLPLYAEGRKLLIPPTPLPLVGSMAQSAESLNAPSMSATRDSAHVSQMIGPQEAGIMDLDGVRLEVPAGALRSRTLIGICKLPATVQLDEGMSNVTLGALGYRFEPHGMQFLKPVRITMAFDPKIAESPTALSNLFTYFYDTGYRPVGTTGKRECG